MTTNKKSILITHICDNEQYGGCMVLIYLCKLLHLFTFKDADPCGRHLKCN